MIFILEIINLESYNFSLQYIIRLNLSSIFTLLEELVIIFLCLFELPEFLN